MSKLMGQEFLRDTTVMTSPHEWGWAIEWIDRTLG
jgi:hypothetical protein